MSYNVNKAILLINASNFYQLLNANNKNAIVINMNPINDNIA